jgi:hypothetical protein
MQALMLKLAVDVRVVKTKTNLNYREGALPYRAVSYLCLGYKNEFMLYREIIAVYSEIHTKHINTERRICEC